MRGFKGECAHFSLNKCPIYTNDGARAKFSTNSQETDNSEGLNMELDIQNLFGLHALVHSCTYWLWPPPLSPHLGWFAWALLVSQDRRHLYVTPCEQYLISLTKRRDWTGCVNSLAGDFWPRDFSNIFENPARYIINLFEIIISCCGTRNNAFCFFLNGFVRIRRRFLRLNCRLLSPVSYGWPRSSVVDPDSMGTPGSGLPGSGFAILIRIQEDKNYPQK